MALINRVRNIIVNPKEEWKLISAESSPGPSLIFSYLFPLALAASIATFIGFSFLTFGFSVGTGFALVTAIIMLVQLLVTVYVNAFVTDALAPSFSSEKNLGKSIQLVVYAATPAYVGAILNIIPAIGSLGTLAGSIYSIYLFYLGIPILKKTPPEKAVGYLIAIIVVMIIVFWIIRSILWRLVFPTYYIGYQGIGNF
ncbi:MAG TPA: Yip1 family protein [Puia sp.]|nr:Yip1 family protein [Puia sp.]